MKKQGKPSIFEVDVTAPISLQKLAPRLGYKTYQLRRILKRIDAQAPGKVLRKVNGRLMVTVISLREFWPEFGKHFPSTADVRLLAEEQRTLDLEFQTISRGMRVLTDRMRKLENKVDRALGKLAESKQNATERDEL